jgi:hypothetical protein
MAKKISMIAMGGDVFLRYEGLVDAGLIDASVGEILKKYQNTWLALSQNDITKSLSGSSEDEIVSYKVSQALTRMTLSDIEVYLTKYPLLKEQKDLGMSGALHMYEISLAKENILALVDAFTKKATDKNMSTQARKDLEENLANINISGIMGLDPKDDAHMSFDGTIVSGSGDAVSIRMMGSKEKSLFSLGASGNTMNLSNIKTTDGYEFSMTIIQEATEVGRMEGKIKKE